MSRKATRRKYRPGLHPLDVIAASQPMKADRVQTIMVKIHDAFAHLRSGGTDRDLFDRVAVCMNVGLVRCEAIGPEGVDLFKRAQDALMESARICEKHGKFGFTGPGLETIREAVALYAELLAASSPRQMNEAQNEVIRRIRIGAVYCPQALAVEAQPS